MHTLPINPRYPASFAHDERGAVAVIVSLLLVMLIGFVALGVDVASLYRERAKLQADSDLAAMSSVANIANATTRATDTLEQNNRSGDTLTILQTGRFLRNPAIAREDRFTTLPAGDARINAVSVTVKDTTPLHFAKIFADQDSLGLTRTSTAIRTGAASFSLDSNVLRLDRTALNAVLSDVLGTPVMLSVGEIQLLSDINVNIGDLLAGLRQITGNAARNPAAILDEQASAGEVLGALQTLLPSGAAGVLGAIIPDTGTPDLPVSAIIGGIDSALGLTAVEFASEIDLSALDVINAVASANGYDNPASLGLNVAVPGVTSVTTRLAMGDPPAHSGWIAMGEEDVQLHRAAIRLQNEITLAPDLLGDLGVGVSVTSLNLPLYLEVAGASATLEEINCNASDPTATAARFSTQNPRNGASVASLYLGKLDEDTFANGPIMPSDLGFADFMDISIRIELLLTEIVIPGITLQARSNVSLGASQTDTISFTHSEIAAGQTTKHFGSGNLLSSGVSSLLSPANTEIRVKPGQEGLISAVAAPVLGTVLAALPAQLLAALTAPLDAVLDTTLDGVGVRLGEGELALTGHHCELVRLVQ
ncbi:pilus assembly protein TadG-related protein [Sulfitobacter sp. F26169L]|uniref:pilus assembly protein TadG-related protein n=1 Tax=Sulfitobacter sp. F26169L TaxID=2996015 RepID=UPI002260A1CD|nr:pilus assembly protein TadG-related protein [Sulfitobacter sp. F26169L]MCX7565072.1 pilus assembly protein TadG-related protein [Sulfitobacter sp. F26169L]